MHVEIVGDFGGQAIEEIGSAVNIADNVEPFRFGHERHSWDEKRQ